MSTNIQLKGHEACSVNGCVSETNYKCKIIGSNNQEPSYMLDIYPIYNEKNVSQISCLDDWRYRVNYGWDIEYDTSITIPEESYFYIDSGDPAFGHWMFESSHYLLLYKKLKETIPSLKLLSFIDRKFKKSVYKALGIQESDIKFSIEVKNNIVFFPKTSSLGDHSGIDLYMSHVNSYYSYLISKCPSSEKEYSVLYLPRGTLENSSGGDRTISIQNDLVNSIESIPNSLVYYSDNTDSMIDQINIVRKANIIILDYGSNMMMNGFFAENSHIIVLNNVYDHLHLKNLRPAMLLFDSINRGNKYYYMESYFSPFQIIQILYSLINKNQIMSPYQHKLKCWKKECMYCAKYV